MQNKDKKQTPETPARRMKIFGWAKTDIKAGEYLAVDVQNGETVVTTKEAIDTYNSELQAEIKREAEREAAKKVMIPQRPDIVINKVQ